MNGPQPADNAVVQPDDDADDNDSVIEGGVVGGRDDGEKRKKAQDADIALIFECDEVLPDFSNHPILKPGVRVKLGLCKSTELADVFAYFVKFCNSHKKGVRVADLEFLHADMLDPKRTAEQSALMKEDTITVRANRTIDREKDMHASKLQREMDQSFFQCMQEMLCTGDVSLECRGKSKNRDQARGLTTSVLCHSAIVKKRCPWLHNFIASARLSTPPLEAMMPLRMQDEDGIAVLNEGVQVPSAPGAAQIENDEEEDFRGASTCTMEEEDGEDDEMDESEDVDDNNWFDPTIQDDASVQEVVSAPSESPAKPCLRVIIHDHPPEAMRLLLEFCYMNRVPRLGGKESVLKSGMVVTGYPIASMWTCLETLRLAECASLKRLSLLCEVAATKKLDSLNVMDVLTFCEQQKEATGNKLPFLHTAAMSTLIRLIKRGGLHSFRLRQSLSVQKAALVPSLVHGVAKAVEEAGPTKTKTKPEWKLAPNEQFGELDFKDSISREKERHAHRVSRAEARKGTKLTDAEKKALCIIVAPLRDASRRKAFKRTSNFRKPSKEAGFFMSASSRRRAARRASRAAAAELG